MTTEERLAALEAKLDALTAPPSDYYTSRYSGEEIDAAIAAVPDKAEMAQLCNRNLLDNWYFGNPVDQRGGYISLRGVPVYNDAACTSLMGNQTETAATCIKSDTNYQRIINGQGSGYVKAADVVRGYVGAGYTVDRWKRYTSSGMTALNEGYVSFVGQGENLDQVVEDNIYKSLRGKTVTLSIIARGNAFIVSEDFSNNYHFETLQSETFTVVSATITVRSDADRFVYHVQPKDGNPVDVIAVKLELGTTQTLAHQDADGNWVLNEVPDYGEQLRRCQRYFYRLKAQNSNNFGVWALGYLQTTTQGRFLVNFPNTMRTVPAYTMSGTLQMYSKASGYAVTSLSHQAFNGNSLLLMANCAANEGFVVGNTASLGAMNDPYAYIDFSADL